MFAKKLILIAISLCALASNMAVAQQAASNSGAEAAPTIALMSQIQRAELDRQSKKRMDALLQGPAAAAAPAQAASAPAVIRNAFMPAPAPPVNTSKRVLAIYGRQGSEIAEIELPNGTITKASAGMQGPGFRVVSIKDSTVVVEVFQAPVGTKSGSKKSSRKAKATKPATVAKVFTVFVGGRFQ